MQFAGAENTCTQLLAMHLMCRRIGAPDDMLSDEPYCHRSLCMPLLWRCHRDTEPQSHRWGPLGYFSPYRTPSKSCRQCLIMHAPNSQKMPSYRPTRLPKITLCPSKAYCFGASRSSITLTTTFGSTLTWFCKHEPSSHMAE